MKRLSLLLVLSMFSTAALTGCSMFRSAKETMNATVQVIQDSASGVVTDVKNDIEQVKTTVQGVEDKIENVKDTVDKGTQMIQSGADVIQGVTDKVPGL